MALKHTDWGRVAVLAGGVSSERAVSLRSGQAIHDALCAQGLNSTLIDCGADYVQQLQQLSVDRVWIALHGGDGENGVVQAVCQGLGLPYTGSSVLASALAMNKVKSKILWQAQGLSTLPFVSLNLQQDYAAQVAHLGYPLAIKPVHGGSSIGVSCVHNAAGLADAVAQALQVDTAVMAEPWITGRELTVGIVSNQALPLLAIQPGKGFYDYAAKYEKGDTEYAVVMDPRDRVATIQALAIRAFEALGCAHWARVDLIEDAKGNIYLLELNVVPGMTSHSLVPKAAAHMGVSFEALVLRILAGTLE